MRIIPVESAPEKTNPHNVDVRLLYDKEHAQVMYIELKVGESLKKHVTPVDVFFFILEGNGIVEIGDESKKVSKDMLIESPARLPHRLINNSEELFRFLVVKTPRPTESTRLL